MATFLSIVEFLAEYDFKKPIKKFFTLPTRRLDARDKFGRKTLISRGGGKRYRHLNVNFYRFYDYLKKIDEPAFVLSLIRFQRTSLLYSFVKYKNGIFCLLPASVGIKIGSLIPSYSSFLFFPSSIFPLSKLFLGSKVFFLQFSSVSNSRVATSKGTFCKIIKKNFNKKCLVELPSGEQRYFSEKCLSLFGKQKIFFSISFRSQKASNFSLIGFRPHVRGVAMNPVDHPHGGGQGKTSGGRPSSSPWGVFTKGKVTRKKSKKSNMFIFSRNNKK